MNYSEVFGKVVSHCKEYGFIFPSGEIYDGLSAVYDYGPAGVQLKRNLSDAWWKAMTQKFDNIVGLDAAILMPPTVWKASGHVDAFNDPLIDNKDSKKRYRADVLVEDYIEKLLEKARKEEEKLIKKGKTPEEAARMPQVKKSVEKAEAARIRLAEVVNAGDMHAFKRLIDDLEIVCPESGTRNWTDVRQFNLMFKTRLGAVADEGADLYLRPETAQGIFVNFLNVQKSSRMKVPFGVAQIGKAFRNEIVARQFIFRMREFEQMEMQYFVRPGTQSEHYRFWKEERMRWHLSLGIPAERLRYKDHDKLAHYADAATDIEFYYPFGWKETEGIHSRTDYDLRRHQEFSGKKQTYFDPETQESYIPYVVETSVGLDRTVLMHLCNAYAEEEAPTAEGGTEVRTVLRFHPAVAPTYVAVLPLVKKDGMAEAAKSIHERLKNRFFSAYDEKDAVGRRYRRQDAKGTPFCVTIDTETLSDGTVTVRERDSMAQERVSTDALESYLAAKSTGV